MPLSQIDMRCAHCVQPEAVVFCYILTPSKYFK